MLKNNARKTIEGRIKIEGEGWVKIEGEGEGCVKIEGEGRVKIEGEGCVKIEGEGKVKKGGLLNFLIFFKTCNQHICQIFLKWMKALGLYLKR